MSDDEEIERAAVEELLQEAKKAEEASNAAASIQPPSCINKRLFCPSLASTLRNPITPKVVNRRRYVGLDDTNFDAENDEKKRPDAGREYDPSADYIYDARKYFDPDKYRELVAHRELKKRRQEELLEQANKHYYQPIAKRHKSWHRYYEKNGLTEDAEVGDVPIAENTESDAEINDRLDLPNSSPQPVPEHCGGHKRKSASKGSHKHSHHKKHKMKSKHSKSKHSTHKSSEQETVRKHSKRKKHREKHERKHKKKRKKRKKTHRSKNRSLAAVGDVQNQNPSSAVEKDSIAAAKRTNAETSKSLSSKLSDAPHINSHRHDKHKHHHTSYSSDSSADSMPSQDDLSDLSLTSLDGHSDYSDDEYNYSTGSQSSAVDHEMSDDSDDERLSDSD